MTTDVRALADLPDDELAERAKTESDAFGVLYDRHVKRIYNYVYYRVGRSQEAEDLTERVFMQALESLPR
jgi:RNA polymerase sigma-70 factor (ECF subfamily)